MKAIVNVTPRAGLKETFASLRTDPTARSLALANLLTIALAITQNWNIMVVLWGYWCQSVIIGIFSFFKILSLKEDSGSEPETTLANAVAETSKISAALFFAVHYGSFHLVYAIFLLAFSLGGFFSAGVALDGMDILFILATAAIFFANHFFSFRHFLNKPRPVQGIKKMMAEPYGRILPMHLTIIFGGFLLETGYATVLLMVFFMLLKTIIDLGMHAAEHAEQQAEKKPEIAD